MSKNFHFFIGFCCLLAALFSACKTPQNDKTVVDSPNLKLKQETINTYADLVYATYEDTYKGAASLKKAIDSFVAAPSADGLNEAKKAWLAVREFYGQTEAFRFYGGPIDDEDGPEGLLNAWPLDETYVDYVAGAPNSGIINDTIHFPVLDADLLVSLNEKGSEENVCVGFHAIEFLLWGQDFKDDGPGARPYTDFIAGGTAANQARRGEYLKMCANLLVEHLKILSDAWNPEIAGNYRETFLQLEPDEALQKILTGISVLSKSELAGERIYTAYDNQNQEDEHSCFSDNTHRDIVTNMLGIKNVFYGEYVRSDDRRISGPSLHKLLEGIDPQLNQKTVTLLDSCWQKANAIPAPFDQAIRLPEQRPKVLEAVNALHELGEVFVEVAAALNLHINTGIPN